MLDFSAKCRIWNSGIYQKDPFFYRAAPAFRREIVAHEGLFPFWTFDCYIWWLCQARSTQQTTRNYRRWRPN
jgi:hypothetical protein